MAFIRALLRTDVTNLTVVTYGGPDLGLLCSAGKVKRVYYGFVSLDSPPFYDPWFAKVRTTGASRRARWTRACCVVACRPPHNACRSCRSGPGWQRCARVLGG